MLYTMIYNTETDETQTRLFYSYDELFNATFDPDLYCYVIDTKRGPAGKTYHEKKNNLQTAAIECSSSWGADHVDQMSYWELGEIQDYFTRYGRRYGLLKEFSENAII